MLLRALPVHELAGWLQDMNILDAPEPRPDQLPMGSSRNTWPNIVNNKVCLPMERACVGAARGLADGKRAWTGRWQASVGARLMLGRHPTLLTVLNILTPSRLRIPSALSSPPPATVSPPALASHPGLASLSPCLPIYLPQRTVIFCTTQFSYLKNREDCIHDFTGGPLLA